VSCRGAGDSGEDQRVSATQERNVEMRGIGHFPSRMYGSRGDAMQRQQKKKKPPDKERE
jgi:hypothetical protein